MERKPFENDLGSSGIGICVKRIGHDDIETMSSPSHKSFMIKEGSHFNMTYSQVLFGTDYASIILSDKIRVSSNDKLILSATNEISIGQTKISKTNDNSVAVVGKSLV